MVEHPPKVFISYSHDSQEHADRVLALADQLRAEGVDVILDQYEGSPAEGWPRWMDRHIRNANFVLMICTQTYFRWIMGEEEAGKGLGVQWEGNLIYNYIYKAGTQNTQFIPVLFEDGDSADIPTPVKDVIQYRLYSEYEALYCRLTDQPAAKKPTLGKLRHLPSRPPDRRIASLPKPAAEKLKLKGAPIDEVYLGVAAPNSVCPGDEFVVRFAAYIDIYRTGTPAMWGILALLEMNQCRIWCIR